MERPKFAKIARQSTLAGLLTLSSLACRPSEPDPAPNPTPTATSVTELVPIANPCLMGSTETGYLAQGHTRQGIIEAYLPNGANHPETGKINLLLYKGVLVDSKEFFPSFDHDTTPLRAGFQIKNLSPSSVRMAIIIGQKGSPLPASITDGVIPKANFDEETCIQTEWEDWNFQYINWNGTRFLPEDQQNRASRTF